jgi:hypothetical protein
MLTRLRLVLQCDKPDDLAAPFLLAALAILIQFVPTTKQTDQPREFFAETPLSHVMYALLLTVWVTLLHAFIL